MNLPSSQNLFLIPGSILKVIWGYLKMWVYRVAMWALWTSWSRTGLCVLVRVPEVKVGSFPLYSLPCVPFSVFSWGSLLSLELAVEAGLAGQWARGVFCLCSHSTGIKDAHSLAALVWVPAGGLSSGPHACTAREPTVQSKVFCVLVSSVRIRGSGTPMEKMC